MKNEEIKSFGKRLKVYTNRQERMDRRQRQPLRREEMQRQEESRSPDRAYPWGESLSNQPLRMGTGFSDSEVKLAYGEMNWSSSSSLW